MWICFIAGGLFVELRKLIGPVFGIIGLLGEISLEDIFDGDVDLLYFPHLGFDFIQLSIPNLLSKGNFHFAKLSGNWRVIGGLIEVDFSFRVNCERL